MVISIPQLDLFQHSQILANKLFSHLLVAHISLKGSQWPYCFPIFQCILWPFPLKALHNLLQSISSYRLLVLSDSSSIFVLLNIYIYIFFLSYQPLTALSTLAALNFLFKHHTSNLLNFNSETTLNSIFFQLVSTFACMYTRNTLQLSTSQTSLKILGKMLL